MVYLDWVFAQCHILVGCALFSNLYELNAVLVELDDLSSGVPSFLKSDNGKLLRIAFLYFITWYMCDGHVITTRPAIS